MSMMLLDHAAIDESTDARTAAMRPGDSPTQLSSLVSNLLDELLNSALLAATTSSIANWIVETDDFNARRSLGLYLPPPPTIYYSAALHLSLNEATAAAAASLRDYYDRLSFLRQFTRDLSDQPSEGRVANSGLSVLAQAWRELCYAARLAIDSLHALNAEDARVRVEVKQTTISEILIGAQDGGHPCVSPDGSVVVPFWAERRHLSRSRISLQAYFLVSDSIQRVSVVDATESGLGVVGLKGATEGMQVALIVKPGHMIDATIRWVTKDRCGISLAQPLPDSSPFLTLLH